MNETRIYGLCSDSDIINFLLPILLYDLEDNGLRGATTSAVFSLQSRNMDRRMTELVHPEGLALGLLCLSMNSIVIRGTQIQNAKQNT